MWKTMIGRCIYESPSGFKVFQNPWYRWLTFGTRILQSVLNRRHPEKPGLGYITPLIHMVRQKPGDCCLLGLGGAGVAHTLSLALNDSRIVAVDYSEEVIDIAKRYFKADSLLNLSIIHQNAKAFVQSTMTTYQYMMIDLYNAVGYPSECNNDLFFKHCKSRLNPEGIMAVNVIRIQQNRTLFQHIRNNFHHDMLIVPVKGTTNTLIFAFNLSTKGCFLSHIQASYPIKKIIWDNNWGYIGQY